MVRAGTDTGAELAGGQGEELPAATGLVGRGSLEPGEDLYEPFIFGRVNVAVYEPSVFPSPSRSFRFRTETVFAATFTNFPPCFRNRVTVTR